MQSIRTNLMSMNTHRNILGIERTQHNIRNQLSTGMRINSAADDAAGLSVSERMRQQIRGLDQATRNINDGISLIQTAEGAMQEISAVISRVRELNVQIANDVYTVTDRQTIATEIEQALGAITEIVQRTTFNGINLLEGKLDMNAIAAGLVPGTFVPGVPGQISYTGPDGTDLTNLINHLVPGGRPIDMAWVQNNITGIENYNVTPAMAAQRNRDAILNWLNSQRGAMDAAGGGYWILHNSADLQSILDAIPDSMLQNYNHVNSIINGSTFENFFINNLPPNNGTWASGPRDNFRPGNALVDVSVSIPNLVNVVQEEIDLANNQNRAAVIGWLGAQTLPTGWGLVSNWQDIINNQDLHNPTLVNNFLNNNNATFRSLFEFNLNNGFQDVLNSLNTGSLNNYTMDWTIPTGPGGTNANTMFNNYNRLKLANMIQNAANSLPSGITLSSNFRDVIGSLANSQQFNATNFDNFLNSQAFLDLFGGATPADRGAILNSLGLNNPGNNFQNMVNNGTFVSSGLDLMNNPNRVINLNRQGLMNWLSGVDPANLPTGWSVANPGTINSILSNQVFNWNSPLPPIAPAGGGPQGILLNPIGGGLQNWIPGNVPNAPSFENIFNFNPNHADLMGTLGTPNLNLRNAQEHIYNRNVQYVTNWLNDRWANGAGNNLNWTMNLNNIQWPPQGSFQTVQQVTTWLNNSLLTANNTQVVNPGQTGNAVFVFERVPRPTIHDVRGASNWVNTPTSMTGAQNGPVDAGRINAEAVTNWIRQNAGPFIGSSGEYIFLGNIPSLFDTGPPNNTTGGYFAVRDFINYALQNHFIHMDTLEGMRSPTILQIQSGANSGQRHNMTLESMTLGSLGLNNFVRDLNRAIVYGEVIDPSTGSVLYEGDGDGILMSSFLNRLDHAESLVSRARANLGAQENRLMHTAASVIRASMEQTSSESRLRHSDMAEKAMQNVRLEVLGQSAMLMFLQGNTSSDNVVDLLWDM
ncbi:MAG: hypothetical protein FWF57_07125 [Defluviitaleaceae bacterium]|nr:hypothetical protein [Defluviitaleaceae bacterium]